MLTLKMHIIVALFRGYDKALTIINNLVEVLNRYNNYKEVIIIKDVLDYLTIR